MKLQELAVANPTKQAARVFESYFGKGIDFDAVNVAQARIMLKRVRNTIAEHRRTTEFHRSEQNPAYLKLVVMEQALSARVMEEPVGMAAVNTAAGTVASWTNRLLILQNKKQIYYVSPICLPMLKVKNLYNADCAKPAKCNRHR